jgi:hypothetical protein
MIAGFIVTICIVLKETAKSASKVAALFALPPAMKSSCCSISLSTIGIVSVLDFGLSNRSIVISHYCLNLHFPEVIRCGVSFHLLIGHLYMFFGEVRIKILGPF